MDEAGRAKGRVPASGPNALFVRWLTELRDEAASKGKKSHFVYQKALSSLKKYPLPLQNGKEAKILQNFGDGICKMLDQKLAEYNAEHGSDASIHNLKPMADVAGPTKAKSQKSGSNRDPKNVILPSSRSTSSSDDAPSTRDAPPLKRTRVEGTNEKGYTPKKSSCGYALIMALYWEKQKPDGKYFMTKPELQQEAQPHCEKSFFAPDAEMRHSAWSSMKTLISKGLVEKCSNPAKYFITDKGIELARRLDCAEVLQGKQTRMGSDNVTTALETVGLYPAADGAIDLTESDEDLGAEGGATGTKETWTTAVATKAPLSVPARCVAAQEETVAAYRDYLPWEPLPSSRATEDSRDMEPREGFPPSQPKTAVPDITLRPGEFDIILCVDVIETTGPGSRKQDLVNELKKNGVQFDVRKLNVGDFVWAAQERVHPLPGQLKVPAARELVLDYIVERKRMDDLCGSIIDGRFKEQKFRLKKCGLRNWIYLVEDFKKAQHMSLPESTLQQAVVNTQVVDNFFIKRTRDIRESAAYLTIMTRYLHNAYASKTLMSCTKEERRALLPADCTCSVDDSLPLITFSEFNQGAAKNKAQTVQEVFARQLLQFSGVSGDKAIAIMDKYPTPQSLMTAYSKCSTDTEREKLLASFKCGKLQRNLGPALSKLIAGFYCTAGPLS
ncbi:structure-specific endonuclease subunit MUS81 [Petromyzon marinus]|uniref:Crossover junction endonuclease MUS81 n=1 Tax=Petromyzon marinus TaxID=7757 RepID=A0AAJ7X3K9_PETMA|nr:crossover junction endonuclease MUS81 [Petromyzon marinus]XP_032820041.1 crossover junction endonuclease MUS81 [Petromyzon marinus]XP_032820042.1 crossover junction endonuclease MUS81 [Petromyzon marinus]